MQPTAQIATTATPPRSRPRRRGTYVAGFLYMWLMVGLALGTAVLVGPVQWAVRGIHAAGWGQTRENVILIAIIVAYVISSWLIARALHRFTVRPYASRARLVVPIVLTVLGGLSLWAWRNPARALSALAGGGKQEFARAGGVLFEFGAYADWPVLERLKRENFTAVISLQHPANPVERQGIKVEEEATRDIGVRLIQLPMWPWVSPNRSSLDSIKKIALSGNGKYYVHCGLGRDRVNLVKRFVENLGIRAVADPTLKGALSFDTRTDDMERGALARIARDVWIIPYPNKHEMFGYIIQGKAGHVFLLLDTSDPLQREWHQDALSQFTYYAVPYTDRPVRSDDRTAIARIVAEVRSKRGPVTVIVPRTPWDDGEARPGAETAVAFASEYAAASGRALRWEQLGSRRASRTTTVRD